MRVIAIIFLGICLAACNKLDADKTDAKNADKNKTRSIEERVTDLEWDNLIATTGKIAFLKIGEDGYSPISFDLGTLTVKIKDVQPYANSSKVQLEIGNPLGATITGLKATIQWGSVNEKGYVSEELGSKQVTIEKNIVAGSWNTVSITLDATDPKKLGFIRVKDITHTGIMLTRAR